MMPFEDIKFTVDIFHKNKLVKEAAMFLIKEYRLWHPNLKSIELREPAKPEFILLTAEGDLGELQTIRIPENVFEFDLVLILNLIAHEMVHVRQKSKEYSIKERNEREWEAYCEMLFHKEFPLVPEVSNFHKKAFASKALDYYKKMGEGSLLQEKYRTEKNKVEHILQSVV